VADPEALRRDAARLLREADRLRAALTPVVPLTGPDVWAGPVADRVAAELADRQRELDAAATELREVAALLRARADTLEAHLREQAAALGGVAGPR
jgi:hypothetical protein